MTNDDENTFSVSSTFAELRRDKSFRFSAGTGSRIPKRQRTAAVQDLAEILMHLLRMLQRPGCLTFLRPRRPHSEKKRGIRLVTLAATLRRSQSEKEMSLLTSAATKKRRTIRLITSAATF